MSETNAKKYVVYLHTLEKDDKKMHYVGITSQNPLYRWGKNGSGYKDNLHFWRAIEKYGWDNFKHEILEYDLTIDEANELEQYYISYYNSFNANHGYNKTRGGTGEGIGNKDKDSHIKKRNVYQFDSNYNFINCYSSTYEAMEKTNTTQIHSGIKNHKMRNNFLWGYKEDVLFDGKTYHLNYRYENDQWSGTTVYQFDRNGHYIKKYDTYKDAAKENNIQWGIIRKNAENEFKSYYTHEYLWRKECDVTIINGIVQNIELRKNELCPQNQIFKFDLNGIFLDSYSSTNELRNKYNYIPSCINSAMHGRAVTAYGFIWRDINEVIIHKNGKITPKNIPVKEKIYQFDLRGNYIKTYDSKKKIYEEFNMLKESLNSNLNKKTYSSFGYIWRLEKDIIIDDNGNIYLKDKFTEKEQEIYKKLIYKQMRIYQFTLDGKYIESFLNVHEASEKNNVSKRSIMDAAKHTYIKTSNGFLWRYEDEVVIEDDGSIKIKY